MPAGLPLSFSRQASVSRPTEGMVWLHIYARNCFDTQKLGFFTSFLVSDTPTLVSILTRMFILYSVLQKHVQTAEPVYFRLIRFRMAIASKLSRTTTNTSTRVVTYTMGLAASTLGD